MKKEYEFIGTAIECRGGGIYPNRESDITYPMFLEGEDGSQFIDSSKFSAILRRELKEGKQYRIKIEIEEVTMRQYFGQAIVGMWCCPNKDCDVDVIYPNTVEELYRMEAIHWKRTSWVCPNCGALMYYDEAE